MKICYVLNQFPELSQTFVLNQIVALVARGHEVHIIAGRRGIAFDLALHELDPQTRSTLRERTIYAHLPEKMGARVTQTLAALPSAAIHQRRSTLAALDPRSFGWFAATGTVFLMARALDAGVQRYDAIVPHFGPQGIVADALRQLHRIEGPLATYFHAYDLTQAPRLAGRGMYRGLFSRGEAFLAISERGAKALAALGAPPEKVFVEHIGVKIPTLSDLPHVAPGPLQLLSVGRLVEKKGFAFAIHALAACKHRGLSFEYRIVGDGPLRQKLERLARTVGLKKEVKFLGPASSSAVEQAMEQAAVLLVPSVTAKNGDEEGIPVVLMEAMARRVAVISTRHGGIPELIESESNGLLVDERDVRALTQAIERLAKDEALRHRLGAQARKRICADFSLETQISSLEQRLIELGR